MLGSWEKDYEDGKKTRGSENKTFVLEMRIHSKFNGTTAHFV
jgi:hypothetical protein